MGTRVLWRGSQKWGGSVEMLDRERRLRAAEQREQARLESRVPAHAVCFSSAASGCLLGG